MVGLTRRSWLQARGQVFSGFIRTCYRINLLHSPEAIWHSKTGVALYLYLFFTAPIKNLNFRASSGFGHPTYIINVYQDFESAFRIESLPVCQN